MKLENTWFNMKINARNEKEAEIFIYDEIGGWGIHANEFIAELKALGDVDTIHLRINSPGGSVIQGNTIFNAIKRHDARVITYVDGLAASMGSVLALAGDEVHMADNALFMIHNPWTVAMGEAEDLRKEADLLDTIKETIMNAYDRSNYDREELSALMDAETWLTAREAKDAGFIDVIDNAMEQAASVSDTMELAKAKEFKIPTDKLIAALSAKHAAEVETLNAELASANDQLAENATEIASKDERIAELEPLQGQVDDLKDEVENLIENHQEALNEARKETDERIAAKAAEIVSLQSAEPVAIQDDNDETNKPMDEDSYWAEWRAQPVAERNKWHAENKHRIGK